VIQGWDKGLLGMKKGGKRCICVPAALGYGAAGSGAQIPPNANLIFTIELTKHKVGVRSCCATPWAQHTVRTFSLHVVLRPGHSTHHILIGHVRNIYTYTYPHRPRFLPLTHPRAHHPNPSHSAAHARARARQQQSKDGKSSESAEAEPAKAETPPRKRADSNASEKSTPATSRKKDDDEDDAAAKKAALLDRMSKMGHSMGMAPDGTPM
jgi:hypothetical protein